MARANLISDLTAAQVATALGWESAKAFNEKLGEYLKRGSQPRTQ